MSNNSPRQFHETVFGYIVIGVVIALLSWAIQRALERSSSPLPVQAVPADSPQASVAVKPSPPQVAATPPPASRTVVSDTPASSEPPSSVPTAIPSPTNPAQAPSGMLSYNRVVATFGGGFYGHKVPLTLETVENDPSTKLSLHFLVENRDDAMYHLSLSHPSETAIAIDDANGEYSFLSSEDFDVENGLTVPPFSRKRFVIAFQPIPIARESLRVQLVFEQERGRESGFSAGSGSGAPRPQKVEIPNIPIYHLAQ